ncbi:exosortase [Oleiphilus messinensis]|uniref:Exosortase n=1 Tax=Oleiphilus messinensis TaxID=141451 RepID=A0A1Y0I8R6_9GAMM|nr:exosortase A [Oleiphilus messinensis]ARU56166.1 exosortase [Oleiphilus messinensis]
MADTDYAHNYPMDNLATVRFRYFLICLGVSIVAVSAVYFPTAVSLVEIWGRSDTFAHCYFVLPAVAYLVWSHRNRLTAPFASSPLWALWLFPISGLWLVASLVDVIVVQQICFVAMIIVCLMSLMGLRASNNILFPIFLLMLAVPIGEELVPTMIQFTADFTVGTLRFMGYPVFREGNHFSLPTGNWSVVEACSGVRYLIASFAIGLVYAYLTYRSFWRRTGFIALSILVPVIANGIRAVIIVLLGHYSNMQIATGADHLIYGWIFFGFVMFLMFWLGGFWSETESAQAAPDQSSSDEPVQYRAPSLLLAGGIIVVGLLSGKLWMADIQANIGSESTLAQIEVDTSWLDRLELCVSCRGGYKPRYEAADHLTDVKITEGEARDIAVYKATYFWGGVHGELINSQNLLVDSEDDNGSILLRGETVALEEGVNLARMLISGRDQYIVYYWSTIAGKPFDSAIEGKLNEAIHKLSGMPFTSEFTAVSAAYDIDQEKVDAKLRKFLRNNADQLGLALDK